MYVVFNSVPVSMVGGCVLKRDVPEHVKLLASITSPHLMDNS